MTRCLLALPEEIVEGILEKLITQHGLRAAVQAFDEGITSATWTTRALEGAHRIQGRLGDRVLTEYLLARTLTDRTRRHHLTTVIYETLEYIDALSGQSRSLERDSVREACVSLVQVRMRWFKDPVEFLDQHAKPYGTDRALTENALALAIHLKIAPVVQQLLEKGISNVDTYFGLPLACAARLTDSSMAALLLNTNMNMQQNLDKEGCSGKDVNANDSERWNSTKEGLRGLSAADYEHAIKIAAEYGTVETLVMLTNVAKDEGAFSPDCDNIDKFILRSNNKPPNAVENVILHRAAHAGRLDVVQYALDIGASPSAWSYQRLGGPWSVIQAAVVSGRVDVVELLLSRGADPHPKFGYPLEAALCNGHMDMIRICLGAGMVIGSNAQWWVDSVLAKVVTSRRLDVLQLLVQYGITFRKDSDLDKRLSAHVTNIGDIGIQAILSKMRKEKQRQEIPSDGTSEI